MIELQKVYFEQEFENIATLYQFLIKNIDFIFNKIGIKIGEEGLTERQFGIIEKENITERQILFYASENILPENVGDLIVLAGAFNTDIIIFIVNKINSTILEPITWLKNAFNTDMEMILVETKITQNSNSV